MTISTKTYNVTHNQYFGLILKQWLKQWWTIIAFPIILQFFLAIYFDIVFLYTGFMTIFIILPIVYIFLFYYYALTPESAYSTLSKKIEIMSDKIIIIFEQNEDNKPSKQSVIIQFNQIHDIKHHNDSFLIMLDKNKYKLLMIPFSAFESNEEQQKAKLLFEKNIYSK